MENGSFIAFSVENNLAREGKTMPVISVKSIEMTKEQKKIVADVFINTLAEVTQVPKDRIYLFFDSHQLDETACGGVLFDEHPPKTARGEFNKDKWNPETDLKEIEECVIEYTDKLGNL